MRDGRVEPLGPETMGAALALLERAPYDNVFLQWLIESGRLAPGARVIVARSSGERVDGVAYDGPQIVLAGEGPAIDVFAETLSSSSARRMIVSPRPLVERFWERARNAFPTPSLVRRSQPVYALEPSWLRAPVLELPGLERAILAETGEIAAHAARMSAGELGSSDEVDPAYRGRIEASIRAGAYWRYRIDGRLIFQCHAGPFTAATVQLQGIWTPPNERGHGHATRALGIICARLLDEHRTLSLYVNDSNRAGIALYERLGFRRVGEFASLIFI
jgi:RimJ/RimL family protein N-acetyltransferase